MKIVRDVHVCFMAGLATAPTFMDEAAERLRRRLRKEMPFRKVESSIFFPYGDWSRSAWRQVAEIRHDAGLRPSRLDESIGGRRAARHLMSVAAEGRDALFMLVGHSGGGVAALHAAVLHTARTFEPACLVVQIGSPKCRVPESLRDRVAYFFAADAAGKPRDPVTRFGSWGCWSRGRFGLRRDRHTHRPGYVRPLTLGGGHPDYFRSRLAASDGRSNLDLLEDEIWRWVQERWTQGRA